MNRALVLLFFVSVMVGCTSFQKKASPDFDRTRMYPNGVYTHQVEIIAGSHGRYQFKGVVKIASDRLVVVGLTPFQTTAFKLEEDRQTKKIDLQVYEAMLKPHEKRILEFYSSLGTLLTISRDGHDNRLTSIEKDKNGELRSMNIGPADKKVKIVVERYDENNIADKFSVETPQFQVSVRVVAYEI